jgi:signal transduction histidine kinase
MSNRQDVEGTSNQLRHLRPEVSRSDNQRPRVATLKDIRRCKNDADRSHRKDRLVAMGEMAVKIAHEVRNPLGSIELFATSLQASLEGQPDLQILAERISSGVKSIDAIISNMLQFIRSGEVRQFEPFDIYEVLDDALFFTDHLADTQNGIDIKLTYHHGPLFVKGDIELMKQVCLNIILNAIQSMPDGGELHITTDRIFRSGNIQPAWVEIRMADDGVGISESQISRIFDPFFTTKEKGTGLGLSIVHNIVEMHGGYIDVESRPGDGTVFSIGLPQFSDQPLALEPDCPPAMGKEVAV